MDDIISGIFLGFVQGVTEFLPISSSGHLILMREIFGLDLAGSLVFDVLLHVATALAIIVYFREDIWSMCIAPAKNKVLWLAVMLGTIPAVVFGLFFDVAIRNSVVVALALIGGSVLFVVAEIYAKQDKPLSVKRGIWIGFFQALALIPGTSRSGATISGGLLLGLKRGDAAKFSFFLGLPVILGAGLVEGLKSFDVLVTDSLGVGLIAGAVTAFVVGLFSIHYLLQFLKNHKLTAFAWYRVVLAILILLFV